jgi:hypothetical protein
MKERAFILPVVLLIITLLVATLLPLQESLILALRFEAEKSLSIKASTQAASLALAEAFFFKAPLGTRIINKCFSKTSKYNRISVERTFCASFHNPTINLLKLSLLDSSRVTGSYNLPNLDYQKIFIKSQECDSAGGRTISDYSISLSSKSLFSNNFCEFLGNQVLNYKTIGSNLKIARTTTLGDSVSVTAKGFIQATSKIIFSGGKHTIAAAGDLLLDELIAVQPTELTLISASGDVKVTSISGLIKLRVFAAKSAKLPSNREFADRGFEDLAMDFLPLGFIY